MSWEFCLGILVGLWFGFAWPRFRYLRWTTRRGEVAGFWEQVSETCQFWVLAGLLAVCFRTVVEWLVR